MPKTSVQIVDLSTGREVHVKKLTVDLESAVVLARLEELLAGHLVTRKKTPQKAGDLPQKEA